MLQQAVETHAVWKCQAVMQYHAIMSQDAGCESKALKEALDGKGVRCQRLQFRPISLFSQRVLIHLDPLIYFYDLQWALNQGAFSAWERRPYYQSALSLTGKQSHK